MRKSLSRLFIFVLTFLVAWSIGTKPAQATIWDWLKAQFQSEEASTNMVTSITQEGVSGEKHVTETSSNLMNVINLHVMGPPEGEDNEVETSMLRESIGPGLINVVDSGIIAMYDPPASSTIYVADLLQNAKIIPQAQAQGLGFASLDPVLETWKNFRNVAYLFFVIVFLVIGFMIMFRAKIGQAAITVQQALPNIIIALLVVTFSYAIAGFLIDIMYLVMFMLAALFEEGNSLITGNIFDLVSSMFANFWDNMEKAVTAFMSGLLDKEFMLSGALTWLSTLSATVIVGLAILISTFKIFFELLKSYVSIILQIVFSPIILMVGAIPGQNTFFSWVKNLTGNLIMWPLLLVCLLVNRMLTQGTYQSGGFMPPFLLGGGQAALFPVLVGIGVLLVIPEIMKEAKKKLGVEEGIMGSLAGSAFKQLQKGWKPTKNIVGVGTKVGASAGLGLAGAATGAGIGYLSTEGTREERMIGAKKGAVRGGLAGASIPSVISKAPKLVKGTISSTITQAQDEVSDRVLQGVGFKRQEKKAEEEQGARSQVVGQHGAQLGEKHAKSQSDLVPQDSQNASPGQQSNPPSTSDFTG